MTTNSRVSRILYTLFSLSLVCSGVSAQEQPQSGESPCSTAEGLVSELYKSVTFPSGTTPDWNKVRAMFLPDAVVVLRTSRDKATVFSVDGFVEDFVAFIERAGAQKTGFAERIIRAKPAVFRDIAHVLVLYEARIPGSPRPPQQGVDSFELIRKDGRWWIVSITNDLPTPDHPIPPELRN